MGDGGNRRAPAASWLSRQIRGAPCIFSARPRPPSTPPNHYAAHGIQNSPNNHYGHSVQIKTFSARRTSLCIQWLCFLSRRIYPSSRAGFHSLQKTCCFRCLFSSVCRYDKSKMHQFY